MFNLQGSELIIILLLALVVLGPEKLPDAMRKAGQFYAELKKMSTGFQSEFKSAVDEPLSELRNTANTLRDSADFTKLQDGERAEKPKSAEMVAAPDPDAVPTDDLPFTPTDAAAAATVASQIVESDPIGDDGPGVTDAATAGPSNPAPPQPFSSSQQLSTSAPQPAGPDETAAAADDDSPQPGEPSGDARPASAPGFSIPEATTWSQHFSTSASPPPATTDPNLPESDDSQGDDPGTSPAGPAAGGIDDEAGERSE